MARVKAALARSALRGLDPRHAPPDLAPIGASARNASNTFARSPATLQGGVFYADCKPRRHFARQDDDSMRLAGAGIRRSQALCPNAWVRCGGDPHRRTDCHRHRFDDPHVCLALRLGPTYA